MKIAVWYHMPHCGAKRALYSHVKGLVARGHEVRAWTPPLSDRAYLPLENLVSERVLPLEMQWRPQRNPVGAFFQPYRDTMKNIAAMQAHCRAVAQEIEAEKFDVVFVNQCASFAASFLGQYLTSPKVLYLQDPLRKLYEASPALPWMAPPFSNNAREKYAPRHLHHALYDALCVAGMRVQVRHEWQNARAYDAVLVNSYFSRESIARAYGISSRVCYLGIDTQHFCPDGNVAREDFVLGIGEISPRKNIELALEAIAKIPSPRPTLVWIGNAAETLYLEKLKSLATGLGVLFEPRLRVEDNQLIDALRRAALVVYVPKLEPFGLAPLEANACGAPVVGVREGGLRETIRHEENGLLAEAEPQSLADAIEHLWRDRNFAAQMGKRGREIVTREWSEDAATLRLESNLERALSERKAQNINA